MDKIQLEKIEDCNGINGHNPLLEKKKSKENFDEESKIQLPENSYYCMFSLLLSIASVMLSTGIAVGALNPALAVLTVYFNETYQEKFNETLTKEKNDLLASLVVSMLLAGGFFGAISIGFLLKVLTRKNAMILMNLTNVLAVLIMTLGGWFAQSYEAIIIGRFVMGLFSGFGMNLIPIVVAECCAHPKQAIYLTQIGVDLSLGGLLGLLCGYTGALGNVSMWPALLSLSAIPSVIYLICSPWLPETPSYLIRNGKKRQAKITLWKLRENITEEKIMQEINGIENYQLLNGDVKQISLMTMFRSIYYRRQLIVVVMVFLQAQLCGINAVGMYSNRIFDEAGFDGESITTASTIVYAIQVLFAFAGSFFVDRFGPKPINMASGSVMSLSLALLTVSMVTKTSNQAMPYVSLAAVTICVVAWACGINVALFPMLSAFTTEKTRETAFFFGGAIFWFFSWLVSFLPPHLLAWFKDFAFLPFAILNTLFVVYVGLFLPNTKNKTTSEIQAYIQNGNNALKTKKDALANAC